MREKLASIGDDFWIDDAQGNHAYRVNGKALRVRDTYGIEIEPGEDEALVLATVVALEALTD